MREYTRDKLEEMIKDKKDKIKYIEKIEKDIINKKAKICAELGGIYEVLEEFNKIVGND